MSKILIIDDDEDFASAVAVVMRGAGFEVDIALDIPSADRNMKVDTPDLIILDVMFPENTEGGYEFARKLRSNRDNTAKLPILMLTAINRKFPLGFSKDDIDDNWMPVDDFMEKPVDLDRLRDKVIAML
jgi:DNA-binding response OmpR family regulator